MKSKAKWGAALLSFFFALASPAQPIIQTNSTFGWATLHTFSSATAITLGQNGLIYGFSGSIASFIYEMSTNGALLWTTAVTNSGVKGFGRITQGADGNLYLTSGAVVVSATTNSAINWALSPPTHVFIDFLTCGADSNLYVSSEFGGANNLGQVSAISPAGSYLWTYSFDGTNNGQFPSGPILQARDGNLYGGNNEHTIYSLSPGGSLRWILNLTNTEEPEGPLFQGQDGSLYAETASQSDILNLSTDGALNWSIGCPEFSTIPGNLFRGADGNIYGGFGRACCFTPGGVLLWNLLPEGGSLLFQRRDGHLYGIGGAGNEITCLSTTGQLVASLSLIGANPSALVQDHFGNIYGSVGSNYGGGQVFELFAGPRILTQPGDQLSTNRLLNLTNTVNYIGAPPLSFQWQKDGANLTDGGNLGGTVRGSLTNQLVLQNVGSGASGFYRLITSNGFGSVSTAPFYIAATNHFPTLLPGGTLSLPNPSTFPYSSIGNSPLALAAGIDGSLYGSTAPSNGIDSVFRVGTNGVIIWSQQTQDRACIVNSLLQGLNSNIFCDVGDGLLVYSNSSIQLFDGGDRPFPAKIIQGPDSLLYWTDFGSVTASTPNSYPQKIWSYSFWPDYPDSIVLTPDGDIVFATLSTNAGHIISLTTNGITNWVVTLDGTNGINPGSIIQGSDGNLYGTTWGNTSGAPDIYGVTSQPGTAVFGSIFSMTTNGVFLWSYPLDGIRAAYPQPTLLEASDGYLYGVTSEGGAFGLGAVFRIAPGGVDFTIIHNFTGGADGANPQSGLVQLSDGSLYGLAWAGGPTNRGTLYRLDLLPAPGAAVFTSATVTNSAISLTFAAIPNRTYQLQYSTDLLTWTNLNAPVTAAQSLIALQDPITSGPQRFYRLVRQ